MVCAVILEHGYDGLKRMKLYFKISDYLFDPCHQCSNIKISVYQFDPCYQCSIYFTTDCKIEKRKKESRWSPGGKSPER